MGNKDEGTIVMDFREYQHIERFGTPAVENIEKGICFIFPKIDGANGSVWFGDDGKVHAGGRHRELTIEDDTSGFVKAVQEHAGLRKLLEDQPYLHVYGEWLVPHSLETYRDECWRRFYVFDIVAEHESGWMEYIPFQIYSKWCEEYGIDFIPPLAVIDHPTYGQLLSYLEKNTYLIKDGLGVGEGIVIKNYQYLNRRREKVWAKIVRSEFKEIHSRTMVDWNSPSPGRMSVERKIVDKYVTTALCEKERAKLENIIGKGMKSIISPLLYNVFECLVREETFHFVLYNGFPTVDFKYLKKLCDSKVKECCKDLFS